VQSRGQKRNVSTMESTEEAGYSAGFPRLPGRQTTSNYCDQKYGIESVVSLSPVRDAKSAGTVCASLPHTVSDGARKLLYELLTRRRRSVPQVGIWLPDVTRDTGLRCDELEDYAYELRQLNKARKTGSLTWLPADSLRETTFQVESPVSQDTQTRLGSSRSDESCFSGFPTFPATTRNSKPIPRRQTPLGDAKLASTACAALPSNISNGAKTLLYELITRPQHEVHSGVSLTAIANSTRLPRDLLEQYARELKKIDRAVHITAACWYPTYLPEAS
jgi:hypothetical protein